MKKAFVVILAINIVVIVYWLLYDYYNYNINPFKINWSSGILLLLVSLGNFVAGILGLIISMSRSGMRPYAFSMLLTALIMLVSGLTLCSTGPSLHGPVVRAASL